MARRRGISSEKLNGISGVKMAAQKHRAAAATSASIIAAIESGGKWRRESGISSMAAHGEKRRSIINSENVAAWRSDEISAWQHSNIENRALRICGGSVAYGGNNIWRGMAAASAYI